MSGDFTSEWLTLREPADSRARNAGLLSRLVAIATELDIEDAVDLGCGTGATWRAMPADLAERLAWTMADRDALLLQEAGRQIGPRANVSYRSLELADLAAIPIPDRGLVTASALFDLCSQHWIDGFVPRITTSGAVLYAALTHDGRVSFAPESAADGLVCTAFEAHQRSDKGLGPAMGPDAAPYLAARLRDAGMNVLEAPSDWILTQADARLQRAYLDGYAAALHDDPSLPQGLLDGWLSHRFSSIDGGEASCVVGHCDILAWPRR
ncbi:hypothetical protein SAMN02745911_1794 [Aureimonas altamirensis DSM 21988]|uniref:Methyltransferase domain-containing protein n=1 Tax=Aureimonas altamirensis DSM 21988 TaxID=1121026 RepID=A0ABY1IGI4_9HYPH|nr:class I SAM-dependent methyltransferase [Aureimonas altamirensis]SHJ13917.1 hypothetical protein SAMN02745911_1794 [Aureimonas altamirensis DSM 21988]